MIPDPDLIAEKKLFLFKYPYLMELNDNSNTFFGIFRNDDISTSMSIIFKIYLAVPEFPKIEDYKLNIFEGLNQIDIDSLIHNINFKNVFELLNVIEEKLKNFTSSMPVMEELPNTNFIINQIKNLNRNNYQMSITSDFTKILINNFNNYENHFIKLKLIDNCALIVVEHSLPEMELTDSMFNTNNSIENHLATFLQCLDQLEEFYDNMIKIDELCFVVDPIEVTTKSTVRIFKLDDKVFIKIIINPLSPSDVDIFLIGPTVKIIPFREKYENKISEWDPEVDVHSNLLRMFDLMFFPPKSDYDEIENSLTCNICYAYRFDGQIPLISCDNGNCNVVFHKVCLKKWFATIKDTKTVLGITFGICPFCKMKLSTSFVHLFDMQF